MLTVSSLNRTLGLSQWCPVEKGLTVHTTIQPLIALQHTHMLAVCCDITLAWNECTVPAHGKARVERETAAKMGLKGDPVTS